MRQLQITQSITDRETRSMEAYFTDISKVELITADEEVMLAMKIKQGDQAALEKLTRTNLRFVISVAKKYQHMGLPLGDLISEGNLGLVEAAKRFDETKGFKFISYAVWWIRQSILMALAEQTRMVRLPMNHINLLTKMNRVSGELESVLERQPTDQELAELMTTDVEKIEDARYYSGHTASYDASLHNDEEYTLLEKLCCPEEDMLSLLTRESCRQEISDFLNILAPKEQQVLRLSFGFESGVPLLPREVAVIIGASSEGVRLIKLNAIKKLKEQAMNLKTQLF
jgi:RNA polymerase primary sigma factor